jgi:ABC-type uncharacterized transport system substrate-binding protein
LKNLDCRVSPLCGGPAMTKRLRRREGAQRATLLRVTFAPQSVIDCAPMANLLRILILIAAAAFATAARAHPHVWVTFESELVYAPDGTLTGIRHAWAFDDMFSAFATQGIESKQKGKFTRDELASLAEINISSLKEFGYFTFVTADGGKVELTDPPKNEYWLDYKEGVLTLNFILPLKQPVKSKQLTAEIYDPSIFIDFAFAKEGAVKFANKPAGCLGTFEAPRELTFQEQKALAAIPADQQNTSMAWGAQFANKITVTCP